MVFFHGTAVAFMNAIALWPMFFFGFAAILIITQMYGLGLKRWMQWGFLALYIIGATIVYSQRPLSALWQPFAIPLIDYPGVLVIALLLWLLVRLTGWRRTKPQHVVQ